MLPEDKRQQLDKIVQQMVTNKESDSNIRFVVDDFKQKYAQSEISPETPTGQEQKKPSVFGLSSQAQPVNQLGLGVLKSVAKPLQNIGNIVAKPVGRLFGVPEDKIGFTEEQLSRTTTGQKIGGFAGDVAQLAIPATKISKISSLPKVAKLGAKALSTGSIISAQEGEVGKEAVIGAGLETVLPGVGRFSSFVAKKSGDVVRRMLKGLGANIDIIQKDPQAVDTALKTVTGKTDDELLELVQKNVKEIQSGFSKIKKQASTAYGKALESLKTVPVKIKDIRTNTTPVLEKHGIKVSNGKLTLKDAEFFDKDLRKKASELVLKINNIKDTSGRNVRKVIDMLDKSKFKTALSDDRIAFNSFVQDLSSAFTKTINNSTDILKKANKQYSQEKQLVEAMEFIFGKQKFGNLKELNKISDKLQAVLNKTDLSEKTINDFLTRIGISPTEFRATEAVRKTVTEPFRSEQPGFSIGEFIRQFTAGVINPEDATRLAVKLEGLPGGIKETIVNNIQKTSGVARETLIRSLLDLFSD